MKEIGCHIIQGYYLGKPMPGDDLEKLLRKWQNERVNNLCCLTGVWKLHN